MIYVLCHHGCKLWVLTESIRQEVQVMEMFLCRFAGLSVCDRRRSSTRRQKILGVGILLLQIKRSWLRWFGHLRRMAQVGFW